MNIEEAFDWFKLEEKVPDPLEKCVVEYIDVKWRRNYCLTIPTSWTQGIWDSKHRMFLPVPQGLKNLKVKKWGRLKNKTRQE